MFDYAFIKLCLDQQKENLGCTKCPWLEENGSGFDEDDCREKCPAGSLFQISYRGWGEEVPVFIKTLKKAYIQLILKEQKLISIKDLRKIYKQNGGGKP